MQEVVIDTNALVYAAKQKLDLYELLRLQDYKPTVLSCVLVELRSLCKSAKRGADRAAAKLAAEIVEAKVNVVEVGKGHADDLILKYAKGRNAERHNTTGRSASGRKVVVLTNDREFKRRLKEAGVDAVSVSKSKQLR